MVSKYKLVMKTFEGRIIRHDDIGVINETGGQDEADFVAMEALGKRLIDEAKALRRLRAMKAA